MAKLTVYVPDELLERTRALNPDANTSQLVQRGLERLSPAEDAPYARRPKDAAELLAAAVGSLREGAAREYENGYRTALGMVSHVGPAVWPALHGLAGVGFDLKRWAADLRRFGPDEQDPEWYDPIVEDLGNLVTVNQPEVPSEPFIRGYQAALRDAWDTVERPEASVAPGGNTDAVDEEEVAAPAT